MNFSPRVVGLLLLALHCTLPSAARAAESFGNCKGYIDTLPTTINSQGVWCLRSDLATGIATGAAITLATNNVTLDCNGHVIKGSAGRFSGANGIAAAARLNAVVRNCSVFGFHTGVRLEGAGHLIERNRVEENHAIGIHVDGDGNVVRRNFVGSMTAGGTGILVLGDGGQVLDNDVRSISEGGGFQATAIHIEHGLAANNRIGNVHALVYIGASAAIELVDAVAIGNVITADPNEVISIRGDGESRSICRRNYIYGYALPPTDCAASDNVVSVDF